MVGLAVPYEMNNALRLLRGSDLDVSPILCVERQVRRFSTP